MPNRQPAQQERGDELSRRRFVSRAAQTFLGVSAMPWNSVWAAPQAEAKGGKADSVIYIFLSGAMSHLDTFDPKPGSETQGPTKSIKTSLAGVRYSEHLPKLAQQAKQLAVVRSLNTETGAHRPGRYLMRTSYKEIASTRHPSLGSWSVDIMGKRNPELPGNVVIGSATNHPGCGFLEARHAPVPVQNPVAGLQNTASPKYLKESQFNRRMALSQSFDRDFQKQFPHREVQAYTQLYAEAIKLLKSKELTAFDLAEEKQEARDAYGDNPLGQGCLLARRLVESKVRFIEVVSGGWDNHRDIFTTIPEKAGQLDQAVAALLADLEQRGLLKSTLVVIATEFGRSPKINQNTGRDHHPGAFSCVLAGAGIRGQVWGKSDKTGHSVADDHVSVADFNATIAMAMGLPINKELISPFGRPFKVAHDGTPLRKLFS